MPPKARPPIQGLYGIVDTSIAPQRSHLTIARAYLDAGVRILQLRMKGEGDDEVLETARALLPAVEEAGAELLINDRLHVAAQLPGVGVHLGQDDISPVDARALLGPEVRIGWSTHTLSQVRRASVLPVDYIGFGPIFGASGKHRSPGDDRVPMNPVGLTGLKAAVEAATVSVVALGGVTLTNCSWVLEAGAAAVAVIGAVSAADEPEVVVRAFQGQMKGWFLDREA